MVEGSESFYEKRKTFRVKLFVIGVVNSDINFFHRKVRISTHILLYYIYVDMKIDERLQTFSSVFPPEVQTTSYVITRYDRATS